MLILAIDTTTRAGSLAVARDGRVLHELVGNTATSHAQRLPLDVTAVCAAAGVTLEQIDLFAVAAGPGSFTGLRVGIASVQGLAYATGRKVVPVSALEAIASTSVEDERRPVAAWMDAQRAQVFAQLFDPRPQHAAGRTSPRDPVAASPQEVLEWWGREVSLRGIVFRGDGAMKYEEAIRSVAGADADVASETPPLAGAVARIAAADPGRAVLPHGVVPIYVRRPDVELARERQAGRA
ncbi:MAG: tRNA (adenosine(37)-N6)-threonylcarbamoyltransferase complex dimerization subunit type 1 TsaB [Vicinamibacterales bacterium]